MNEKTYDILKYMQRIALPAVLAFLIAILPELGADAATVRLVGTIGTAVLALFGALMQREYNKWSDELEENIRDVLTYEYQENLEKGENEDDG